MSIDNLQQVYYLIEKMNASLPIPIRATPEILKLMEKQGDKYKLDHEFLIEKIFYAGDEGGIICSLNSGIEDKTKMIVSLTHLRIGDNHPLVEEIKDYQRKRSMRIALQDGRTRKATRIAKQNRPKKGSQK